MEKINFFFEARHNGTKKLVKKKQNETIWENRSLRKRKDSEGPKILSLTQVTATQESEMWEVGGR